MKKLFSVFAAFFLTFTVLGSDLIPDTTRVVDADQVVVRSSSKETNRPWSTPNALSVITPFKINQRGISNVKGLSTIVPNLFMPDYGSRMTTPVYLRGVGARSSGQSVGMYIDNIPYMDKSTFDFELMDIQRVEVLRGPQGTLYGRNAMGGIINIYTISPFDYQGTRVQVGAGNYGFLEAKASTYQKLSDKVAISAGAYWDQVDGYFRNEAQNHAKADGGWNAGGRIKLEWRITDRLTASLASSYDYTDQDAFPYGAYDKTTNEIANPNFNDRGTYLRNMSNNSLRLEYRTDKLLLTSNTGYQWLNDNMWMDQDFSPASIFTINQRQLQNSINQEITLKSVTNKNYQWSVGFFGFYNSMKTGSQVMFKQDGIADILQPVFDNMMPPTVPIKLTIKDNEIENPGDFFTPSYGLAVFHQSTFNNILTEGLSATIGIRLDYEHQYLNYNTSMGMNILASNKYPGPGGMLPPMGVPMNINEVMEGGDQQQFLRALPKVSIKYECTPNIMTYATVSRGYKAGGYNIQMFSEVIQENLRNNRPPMPGGKAQTKAEKTTSPALRDVISYKPESVWNYEVGTRGVFLDGKLSADLALFYMDVTNLQLTQFVTGGSGRILTNAGRGSSCGAEVAINAQPVRNLFLDAAYGFTHSTFRDYDAGTDKQGNVLDYSGNYVPYTPAHTFSFGASYTFDFHGWVKGFTLSAQFNGAGKIFWNEANDVSQPFYGLLNAKASLRTDWVRLELWANNITSTQYGAFYFESFGNSFIQKGRPFTCGVNLAFTL